jgi:hypothetical protein
VSVQIQRERRGAVSELVLQLLDVGAGWPGGNEGSKLNRAHKMPLSLSLQTRTSASASCIFSEVGRGSIAGRWGYGPTSPDPCQEARASCNATSGPTRSTDRADGCDRLPREATDGPIGEVDEATYEVGGSYLVVDADVWIFGRKVVIPAGAVTQLDIPNELIALNLTKEQIRDIAGIQA